MIRADLHVHSEASKRPSEWFLQKVGARECYTDIHTLYRQAKACGMDFVTVTDHNTIEGAKALVAAYPDDTFISVEVTTYFPENNCKIHILLYGITEDQFRLADDLRQNIYLLRDFIRDNDIAYSVAHGFYSVNSRLDLETAEKLILLFDVFETVNGARNKYYNEIWETILSSLTPAKITVMAARYGIRPISRDPWIKGFTGGSDDHAGLFIGQTFTACTCRPDRSEFITGLKNRKTSGHGRCHDYKSFAFSIYKIFCDYSSQARNNAPGGILSFINAVVFEDRQSRLRRWFTLRKVRKGRQIKDKIILKFFEDVQDWSQRSETDTDAKINGIYNSMGLLLDEFFKMLLDSFVNDFAKGDIGKLFRNMMSALPAFFISVPFFSALRHLSQDRDMILELKEKHAGPDPANAKKILWFSDTLHDLNGVSVTLGRFRKQTVDRGLNITFAGCLNSSDDPGHREPNLMRLPCIYSITPDFYPSYTLNFPSLLASMEMVYKYRPERIIVSTPGPVGILGMVMAGILGIECISIFHTDFAAQAEYIFGDQALAGLIQSMLNRFYAFSTHIKVPTREYIGILAGQNYPMEKMSLFKRGIDVMPARPRPELVEKIKIRNGIREGTTLLWAGRVSRDKNIEFLMSVYSKAVRNIPDLNLILCGDGPDLAYFKKRCQHLKRVHFTGYLPAEKLDDYYEFADAFVFPSTTDTFGMVILEAQAKGLVALVTDIGGPQEIIDPGQTGYVISLASPDAWVDRISRIHDLKTGEPEVFARMKKRCRDRVRERYSWDDALADILGEPPLKDKMIAA